MNVTEEEDQFAGNDITAHAGIFVFPISEMPVGREFQICLKYWIYMQRDIHGVTNSNLSGNPEQIRVDLTTVRPNQYFIISPEMQDETPNRFAV